MVNKSIFGSGTPGKIVPATDAVNEAGGVAYARGPEEALAQLAATGCFNSTFYTDATEQLATMLDLAGKVDVEFLAKCAVYSRHRGLMKDMPAALCAVLGKRDVKMLARVFPLVIDNGKMLRNFVQVVRSGVTGRKSFGTAVRRLIRNWFDARTDEQLFHQSIGTKPSIGDIVKMAHPKPGTEERRQMLAYLIGRPYDESKLPEVVRQFESFKRGEGPAPDINFQFLSALPLTEEQWKGIARNASWQTLRMNLNTFERHGCFNDHELTAEVCRRLGDADEVKRSKAMPYQLLAAYLNVETTRPGVKLALAQAVEHATLNVPELPGQTVVAIDVSGSMRSPITGHRIGSTSKVRCVDVAALFACSIVRRNPTALVYPFDEVVHNPNFMKGSVVDSAEALAKFGGGGTNCSLVLGHLNGTKQRADTVIYISDNESWIDSGPHGRGTAMMDEWRRFQKSSPAAKLVCIDLTPTTSKQTVNEANIANVGGFSDAVFDFLTAFVSGGGQWTERIKQTVLPT